MKVMQLTEAARDLESAIRIAQDGGPLLIFHDGKIVAELHPHQEGVGEEGAGKPQRSREEVFRSMDERREAVFARMRELRKEGPRFTSAELDEFRRQGRRY